jgi:hypothetical protein
VFAVARGWARYVEVESGKRSDRPELAKALDAARKGKATLLVAKLYRLARNLSFIAALMDSGVDFVACDQLSLRKIVFGSGIGKPMVATGNSLSGECRLGHGRDLVIKVGLWAASHSKRTIVERNSPGHRNRRSCTATTRG